jgi:hypothetical protein
MKDRPDSVLLTGVFYHNEEGSQHMREKFARAWHKIHRKKKDRLGKKLGVASDTYTRWVIKRVVELEMPYSFEKLSPSTTTPSSVIPFETVEEFQELLARMKIERDTWERKFHMSELENKKLKEQLKEHEDMLFMQDAWILEKDDLIKRKDALLRQDTKRKRKQGDLFSPGFNSKSGSSSHGTP